MLWAPVVQAVTVARLGPRAPVRIEMFPEIMLMMLEGTKKGDTLRTLPVCSSVRTVSSMVPMPPIPEPTCTPTSAALASVISKPDWPRASSAAATP